MARRSKEDTFLADYRAADFPPVAITVDVALFTLRDGELAVLLVKRGAHPHKGRWALPGGFVRPLENADSTARRELAEETGVTAPSYLRQLNCYSEPKRDPRMRVVSIAHVALMPDVPKPQGGDDAADAKFWPVAAVAEKSGPKLAFDHALILTDAIEFVRAEIETSPMATSFLTEPFTVPELRRVYEAIWGVALHPANFRRKVLSIEGFVKPAQGVRRSAGGGPGADLFVSGSAKRLQPTLLRPTT